MNRYPVIDVYFGEDVQNDLEAQKPAILQAVQDVLRTDYTASLQTGRFHPVVVVVKYHGKDFGYLASLKEPGSQLTVFLDEMIYTARLSARYQCTWTQDEHGVKVKELGFVASYPTELGKWMVHDIPGLDRLVNLERAAWLIEQPDLSDLPPDYYNMFRMLMDQAIVISEQASVMSAQEETIASMKRSLIASGSSSGAIS